MESRIDYYRVKWGDTLQSVSQKMYGRPDLHGQIFRANSMTIPNPNQLVPGQKLAIPKLGAGNLLNAIVRELVDDD